MKMLATLMMVEVKGEQKLMAIAPDDDIFVVLADDASPDMKALGRTIAKETGMAPFAFVLQLETHK